MDFGTVGGIIGGLVVIIFVGIGPARIGMFIDIPSMAIVLGGTASAMFICYPMGQIKMFVAVVKNAFLPQKQTPIDVIKQIVSFAEQARREGILALESRAEEIDDEYLKKGIQLAVDGTEPELIKDIMNTEVAFIEERHKVNYGMLENGAALAPAFGMVGTLVGLVLMLANMSDPTAIGPAMAVALITTLYGALSANLVLIPLGFKLKHYSSEEILVKKLMLEGIMSLQSGDNPRIVEWKLASFVDPETRLKLNEKED